MCSGRVRPKLCGEPPQRTGGPPVLPGILARTPAFFGISLGAARAQDALNPPETGELVISATRFPLPEEETPASVSVITPRDLEEKQIERISDALRDIPGLSVVQSGAPGQLTSIFTHGLKSEHTQVLLDGNPDQPGTGWTFQFADLTTDDIDRIEIVRGPQSTLSGPRGLAGVIQIFTKQGSGPLSGTVSAEAGSYDTFRETLQTSGSWQQFDYSLGASRPRYGQRPAQQPVSKQERAREPRLVA